MILDYLTLNIGLGLDNSTIKCCDIDREKISVDAPPMNTSRVDRPQMSEIPKPNPTISGVVVPPAATPSMSALGARAPGTSTLNRRQSHIRIAAIDDSCRSPTNIHAVAGRSLTDGYTLLSASSVGRSVTERGIISCRCRRPSLGGRRPCGSSDDHLLWIPISIRRCSAHDSIPSGTCCGILTVINLKQLASIGTRHGISFTSGKSLFVYPTFRNNAYYSPGRRPSGADSTAEGSGVGRRSRVYSRNVQSRR